MIQSMHYYQTALWPHHSRWSVYLASPSFFWRSGDICGRASLWCSYRWWSFWNNMVREAYLFLRVVSWIVKYMLGLFVPFEFVRVCVCLGLHQRGLFCASGSEARCDELKKSLNGGEFQGFRSDDVHAVASLLVLFLRELPNGLIPWWSAKWLLSVYTSTFTLQSISVCLHLKNSKTDRTCFDSYSITQKPKARFWTSSVRRRSWKVLHPKSSTSCACLFTSCLV